jgi:hypothetical protein
MHAPSGETHQQIPGEKFHVLYLYYIGITLSYIYFALRSTLLNSIN